MPIERGDVVKTASRDWIVVCEPGEFDILVADPIPTDDEVRLMQFFNKTVERGKMSIPSTLPPRSTLVLEELVA
jgi:hypothetical protein